MKSKLHWSVDKVDSHFRESNKDGKSINIINLKEQVLRRVLTLLYTITSDHEL